MKTGVCQSCGRAIYWVTTDGGQKMPVEYPGESRVWCHPDGTRARIIMTYVSHFANCPNADKHRKR